jgi:signal transduction histidine kinase
MPRLTFATRIGLIAVVSVGLVWIGAVALFYLSQSRATSGTFPLPAQIAAIVELVERTPRDGQAAVLEAVSSDTMRVRLEAGDRVGTSSARPLLRLGERALERTLDALGGRRSSVTLPDAARARWLARLAPDTLELRIALSTDQTLVVDTRSTRLVTLFGLPVGFGAGLFGTLIALIALVVIHRETRPLARHAAQVDGLDLTRIDEPSALASTDAALRRGAPEIRALVAAFDRLQTRLAQLMKARMAMLGGISHDVRTFATRLRLRVDAIPDADARQRAVGDIDDMIALLDDALLTSRAHVGELRDELVEVADVVRADVADRVAAGATIALHVVDGAETTILGDRIALRRIAANLLDNAARYGRRVEVGVTRVDDLVEFTVDDDGPGIPADRRELLLEPFVRLEGSRNRATGGAGLGLAVVRTLVEAQGGSVRILDGPLGGARLCVRLPAFTASDPMIDDA